MSLETTERSGDGPQNISVDVTEVFVVFLFLKMVNGVGRTMGIVVYKQPDEISMFFQKKQQLHEIISRSIYIDSNEMNEIYMDS